MSQTRPEVLSRSVQETDAWLKELKEDLRADNPEQAYGALRSVLHTLRDRLTVEMAAHLSAQLPMLIKGIFFDGWKPAATPTRVDTPAEFLEEVRRRAYGHQELDPNHATQCVFRLLARKLSAGQIDKVLQQLPNDLTVYWRDAADRAA